MERLLGIVGLCLLVACVTAFVAHNDPRLQPLIFAAIGMGVLSLVLVIIPEWATHFHGTWDRMARRLRANRWLSLFGRFVEAYGMYRGYKRVLVGVGIVSFGEQLLPVLVIWTLAQSLDVGVDFTMALVVVPVTLLLQRLPISVGGFGVGEGVMVYLLSLFGIPSSAALALAVSGQIITLISSLPGVFFWPELSRGQSSTRPASLPEQRARNQR
jgi:uncharacterized protein (TIRG00374 family)